MTPVLPLGRLYRHDDGISRSNLDDQAQSFYLAFRAVEKRPPASSGNALGIRAANYPSSPDDMG